MRFPKLSKRLLVMGGGVTTAILLVAGSASADIWAGLESLLSGGDFYDFGSVFVDESWENPIADIVSDNIKVEDGFVENSSSKSVFDVMVSTVQSELGLPDEVIDVINGGNPLDVLSGVLNDAMADLGLGNINLADVLGKMGIPVESEVFNVLKTETQKSDAQIFGNSATIPATEATASEMATMNVNPSLITSVQALGAVTKAITASGLTEEGQEITQARQKASTASVVASEQMASQGTALAESQLEAAQELAPIIESQTSTQDVLKEALSGIALLQAQSIQMDAYSNEQRALGAQLEAFNLQTLSETRNGVFGVAEGVLNTNEQLIRNYQQDLATKTSNRVRFNTGIRTISTMH